MIYKLELLGALIGLVGVCETNKKTEDTDNIIFNAIRQVLIVDGNEEQLVKQIHEEKNRISPYCEVCKNPCGNTSDFKFVGCDEKEYAIIEEMLIALQLLIKKVELRETQNIDEAIILCYTALATIRWVKEITYLQQVMTEVVNYV